MPGSLTPMPYHQAVADLLERENPAAFAALTSTSATSPDDDVDQQLLRHAYRLGEQGHPEVIAAVTRAAVALGVDVPVEVFTVEGGQEPAALLHRPDKAVLLLGPALVAGLDGQELCAVAGHELAHHVLWTADGGRHLATSRLLGAAESDARTPRAYLETARRHRLATELFADRGALLAAESLPSTISALLKATTGLPSVDVDAYLRQAAEVDLARRSGAASHPETVLRAWALQQWHERGPDADDDVVAAAISPRLDLDALDVLDQDTLDRLTRILLTHLLATPPLGTEEAAALARRYRLGPTPVDTVRLDLDACRAGKEVRHYLAAVVLDVVTADPDADLDAMAAGIAVARVHGLGEDVERLLAAELALRDKDRARVARLADTVAVSLP